MSVIVKNMEMPKNCQECALYIEGACYAKGYRDYRSIMDTAKPDDCPLVELPPHGRLIDADKLNIHDVSPAYGFCVMGVTEEDIELADTIIEGSKE